MQLPENPRISVVVPTRLRKNPISDRGNLLLDRALMSIKRQTVPVHEIIVATDPGGTLPERFSDVIHAQGLGQAAAMNAGAALATGDLLAFLEDDDQYEAMYLETALAALGQPGVAFVSSSSREVDELGAFIRYNDYPSPSGWLMPLSTWNAVGGFDPSYRWHIDNDWLGRLKAPRLHLAESGARNGDRWCRDWLANVGAHSGVALSGREPLVIRCRNMTGGMATIARNPDAATESRREYERLVATYGQVPW